MLNSIYKAHFHYFLQHIYCIFSAYFDTFFGLLDAHRYVYAHMWRFSGYIFAQLH
ncbi:unnamed protein product [Meloidogyne enterolobii]|uniref:Uncharacterized protein n=1 Tax=Meloidogyne enterolobii TaxID=390850 RepID=A0ACB0ZPK5_MELEN